MKYSKEINKILKNYFKEQQEPNLSDVHMLAEKCGLTPIQVKSWFRNKIYKEIRKSKRMQHKKPYNFEERVKKCKIHKKKLNRWLDTANRYMNCNSSDTSSTSSWEHTRSEDEDEDDVDSLTMAANSAHAALLASAAELASIINGYEKNNDTLEDRQSASIEGIIEYQIEDDNRPSTSKAAIAAAKAKNLQSDPIGKVEPTLATERPVNMDEFPSDDDQPSTSKAAAARLLYRNQQFLKKQGVKKEDKNQDSGSSIDEQPIEIEIPLLPIKGEDNKPVLYGNCFIVSTTEQTNVSPDPENEVTISTADTAAEDMTEVNYLYDQEYLLPVALEDFDNDNEEQTTETQIFYLFGYGNFNSED